VRCASLAPPTVPPRRVPHTAQRRSRSSLALSVFPRRLGAVKCPEAASGQLCLSLQAFEFLSTVVRCVVPGGAPAQHFAAEITTVLHDNLGNQPAVLVCRLNVQRDVGVQDEVTADAAGVRPKVLLGLWRVDGEDTHPGRLRLTPKPDGHRVPVRDALHKGATYDALGRLLWRLHALRRAAMVLVLALALVLPWRLVRAATVLTLRVRDAAVHDGAGETGRIRHRVAQRIWRLLVAATATAAATAASGTAETGAHCAAAARLCRGTSDTLAGGRSAGGSLLGRRAREAARKLGATDMMSPR
jgi:hypothetical protein